MALIGYARGSTVEQHPEEVQVPRLKEAGCEKVFVDKGESGSKASRPEWDKCLAYLREGDVLVATKLDRFGRSTKHLMEVAADLEARKVGLRCLDQPIDTKTAMGKLFFTILAAFAEFERDILIERTHDGLAAAREAGNLGGRPKSYDEKTVRAVLALRASDMPMSDIAKTCKISRRTAYRVLEDAALEAAMSAVQAEAAA